MKKSKPRKKVLEEILTSKNFDRLSCFSDQNQWPTMTSDERELLGLLFVMQGEKQLTEGNNEVLDSFKLANQVAPNCPLIMYRQALAFAKQHQNVYCLKAACRVFEKVTEVKPDFFDAWHCWGNALVLLGLISNEEGDFQKGLEKFLLAEEIIDKVSKHKSAHFYRDWGVLWYHFGKFSGEAFDFRSSIKMFVKAAKKGLSTHDFWNDYGNCLVEISSLLNKPELIVEAVKTYWKAIKIKPEFYKGWMNLASSLKTLYERQPLETYYTLANESFDQAAKINPQNANLWLKWGQLQAFKGRATRDLPSLRESCQKFETADICEPNHPLILSAWGEALIVIGEWTDELKAIKKAEEKIVKSLEIQPDHVRIWYLYGNCLSELGRYFGDEEYYLQAIEKFQYGLKLDAKDYLLWYGMALAVFSLGQIRGDIELIEEACQFCRKVIENGGQSLSQFWNDWGVILMKLGNMTDEKHYIEAALNRFEQALRLIQDPLREDSLNPEWLYNYGCALDYLGDFDDDETYYERAVQVLNKVITIDPHFHHAYYNLSLAYTHLGEITLELDCYKHAEMAIETYLSFEPEDEYAWNEWGYFLVELAQLIRDPSRPDEYKQLLEEAGQKFLQAGALGSSPALYHLACIHSLQGNHSTSLHFLERTKENHALPPIEDLMHDDWLESVRQTHEFRQFLSHL